MKQKVIRHGLYAALTLLLCLQTVLPFGTNRTLTTVEAASSKIAFASSIKSDVKKAATKAGATSKTKIGVAKVNNYIDVYSKRSTSGTLKGRLYRGSGAYVIKTKGSWSYISSGSLKGWVKSKYLVTGTKGKNLVKEMNPRVATVTASELNVRESASTSSRVIVNTTKGTRMIVLSVEGKWAKVRVTNDTVGYIYKKYAKIETGLYTGVTRTAEKKMEALMEETGDNDVPSNGKDEDEETTDDSGKWVSLGSFKITAYCACAKCNGSSNAGKTATGVAPSANHTIAVDRSVIPLGSKIRLGNSDTVYVAEDTGVKGNHIDVFHDSHSEALDFGVKNLKVYIYQD